jgi:tetratricopeptide (TPR) repeat protein
LFAPAEPARLAPEILEPPGAAKPAGKGLLAGPAATNPVRDSRPAPGFDSIPRAGPATQVRQPVEDAPTPRKVQPEPPSNDPDRALLLGAARNAVRLRNWESALSRFEEYFRRYGRDESGLRKEYAGVLVQAGRLRQAFQEYQDLLTRLPGDAEVRTALADLAVRTKDFRQAISLLTPALQREPANAELATRLARAFIFEDDFSRALQVYDQYLARLRPGDDKIPDAFPALLVDLERPADAASFLQPLLARQPNNLELLATLVRARARLGERPAALAALEQLMAKGPEAVKVALDLADTLYAAEEFDIAAAVLGQLLRADPANGEAHIGLAQVYIQLYEPGNARALLENFIPTPALKRRFLQARAEYHQLVGEYADAKQIYERFLREDENDHESRLSLGALYEEPLREDERAKAEFGKIPAGVAQYRPARAGIAAALTNQRLFPDAIAVCKALLAEYPSDGNAVAQWARTLVKAGQFPEAVFLCRSFLEANARNIPAARTVRLALGKVLLDAHRRQEAVHEFEQVLCLPGGRTPSTLYGLARAAEGEGTAEKARQILMAATSPLHEDARHWLMLADLYSADAEDHKALEMAQVVLHGCPDNLAALVRAVTAQSRLARASGHSEDTVAVAKVVLAVSSSNVRTRLDLARALASAQHYAESIAAYESLIAIDPTARLPRRERARMLQSDNQYAAAQGAYAELLLPPAGERLQAELHELAGREPRVRSMAAPHLPPDLSSQVLKTELTRAGESDPDVALFLNRLWLDYQARSNEQAADQLEAEIKDKDWRRREMIPLATELLRREPSNTSVLFDLAQDYGSLRFTHKAMEAYAEGIRVDPHERESAIGLERAGLELAPQGGLGFFFFNQIGRMGLARVSRYLYSVGGRVPYGDEDEYVSAGFTFANYVPKDDRPLQGNILSGGFQVKPADRFRFYGLANIEDYTDRFSPRVTFDTGARYDFCDAVQGKAGLYLNNVVENGETMRQDIYRYGALAGVDLSLSRRWSGFATYTYGHYADHNDFNEMYLRTDYIFFFPPAELKAILSTDLQNFRSSTVFRLDDPSDLHGITHPYFSPRLYVYYEGRLSWKQWLSRDYFTYAQQCWYDLEYALGYDNSLNAYHTLRAQFNADIKPWLSVGADARVIMSPVYNAEAVTAYLVLRWPCCGR